MNTPFHCLDTYNYSDAGLYLDEIQTTIRRVEILSGL